MDRAEQPLAPATDDGGTSGSSQSALEARIAELERANAELERANVRLARNRLGASDAAAASALNRLGKSEAERLRMQRSLSWVITSPLRMPLALARRLWPHLYPYVRAVASRLRR